MKLNLETRNIGAISMLDPDVNIGGDCWNLGYLMGVMHDSIQSVDVVSEPEPKEKPE